MNRGAAGATEAPVRDRTYAAGLAAIVGAEFFVRAVLFHRIPLNDNEAATAVIARGLGRGAKLYTDLVEIKPPGSFLLFRWWDAVFGLSDGSVRMLATLACLATTVLLGSIVRRVAGRNAGWAAAGAFAFFSLSPFTMGWAANTDLLTLPFVAGGYWIVVREWSTARWVPWIGAGMLIGCAAAIKQTAAIHVLVLGAVLAFRSRHAAGAALVAGGACAVPVWWLLSGAPDPGAAWYWAVSVNVRYAALGRAFRHALPWELPFFSWREFAWQHLALAGAAIWCAWRGWRSMPVVGSRVVLAWLAAALAPFAFGGWTFTYWFVALVPPLCLLFAFCWQAAWSARAGRWILAAFAAATVVSTYDSHAMYVRDSGGLILQRVTGAQREIRGAIAIALDLHGRASAGETFYVFGSHPEIYWYSGVRPAVPHIWDYTRLRLSPDRVAADRQLLAARPDWVVVVREERAESAPLIRELLASGYEAVRSIGGVEAFDLWRRNPVTRR